MSVFLGVRVSDLKRMKVPCEQRFFWLSSSITMPAVAARHLARMEMRVGVHAIDNNNDP